MGSQKRYTHFYSVSLTGEARDALRDLTELMREAGMGKLSRSDVVLIVQELAHGTSNEDLQICARDANVISS